MNWTPLIQNDEISKYKLKLDRIYHVLRKSDDINNIGFHAGKMGICMFIAYYAIYNDNNKIKNVARSLFTSIEDEISKIEVENYSDFIQFSEFGWFALQMHESGLIEIDHNVYFTELDELLSPAMSYLISNEKYDCINGAINIGLYFLSRYKQDKSVLKYILNFIDLLKNKSIIKNEKVFWKSVIDLETNERGVNMGIAHGVPGIILYLTKLLENGIVTDDIKMLLSGACNFILSVEQDFQKYHSYFSGVVLGENEIERKETRIAWCYGDLGIAYSLLKASQFDIHNKNIINTFANKYLYSTIERSRDGYTGITDACLCHGAIGAAHIYNRLYQMNKDLLLKDIALYWYKKAIQFGNNDSLYAGFKSTVVVEWEREFDKELNLSFLTGLSGIGLGIISAISIIPKWDEFLLLS